MEANINKLNILKKNLLRSSACKLTVSLVVALLFASSSLAQNLHTSVFPNQSSVIAGNNITYDFQVTNNTGAAATGVVFNLNLPAGITLVANTGVCSNNNPLIVTCNLGNIANTTFSTLSITLNVIDEFVKDTGGGFITFIAFATNNEGSPINIVVGDTPVTELADLHITNFAQDTQVLAGETIFYTIYVDNYGPSAARSVTITDTLLNSDQLSIQSCAFSVAQGGGLITQFTCTTGPVVTTQFGSDIATMKTNLLKALAIIPDDPNTPADESAVYGRIRASFRMVALSDLVITSDARVISLTPDPDSSNNQKLSEVVGVEAAADLDLVVDSTGELQPNGSTVLPFDLLSGDPFPDPAFNTSSIAVTAGRRVRYSYTITNNGPSDGKGVEITSRLPAGVTVVPGTLVIRHGDGSTAPGNCQFGTPGLPSDEMTCGLGNIDADTVFPPAPAMPTITGFNIRTVEFEVMSNSSLSSGTVLVNNVLLGSSVVDIDNSNNLGSSLMVISPLTGVSSCSVGGPYTNVVCGNGSAMIGLNGFGFALPDTGTLDLLWTTTCPGASFSDPTVANPDLSFITANPDNTPVSCQVDLAVQNAFASSTCNGVINVVDCTVDCFGVLNGTAVLDRCGVCNGDGNSCLGCNTVDTSTNIFALNKSALVIRNATFKAAAQLKDEKASKKARRKAKRNFRDALKATANIPTQITSCTNNAFCVQTNNIDTLDSVNVELENGLSGLKSTVNKLKSQSGKSGAGKKLVKKGSAALNSAQAALVSVPLTSSNCL